MSSTPDALARQLIDPQDPRLRELYRRRPWRAVAAILRCWIWIAGALALAAWRGGIASYAVALVVIGTQQYALSILSHEGKHRNLFASPTWNDFAALWLTSAPLGTDFHLERRVHLEHHAHLGETGDPDRDLYRSEDKAERWRLAVYLTGMTTLPGMRHRASARTEGAGIARRVIGLVVHRRHAVPAQLAILAFFTLVLDWWLYPILWIVPLFVFMLVPQRIRQFCEHAQPVVPDHDADQRRLVTYRPAFLERIFLAPFHMGHHAEHHLWPAVPWFALPRLAALVPDSPAIERRTGYAGFLLRYLACLPFSSGHTAVRGTA